MKTVTVEDQKNKRAAIIGIVIWILGLAAWFIFGGLSYPDPPIPEEVVEVEFLDAQASTAGGGQVSEAAEEAETVEQPVETPVEEVETPVAEEVIEQSEDSEVEHNSGQESTETTQTVDPNKIPDFSNIGGGNTSESGTGTTGTGTSDGEADGPGHGSIGDNGDWSLAGRALVGKPSIQEQTTVEGTVVLNIWVNRNGKVTRTSRNLRLSNTNSDELFTLADKAARKAKFNAKPDAAVEQKGTMTFHFILN